MALRFCVVAVCALIWIGSVKADDNITYTTVATPQGSVRGVIVDYNYTVPVSKFLGVPYAKPPIGSRRFAAPESSESWAGVRDALAMGNICMQSLPAAFAPYYAAFTQSEDCLYLNIYTPTPTDVTRPLPVMVWIHGGGYTIGTGSFRDGGLMAQQGVVVVTINYRLDAFGFMSTEDDTMPGNYGMMDQVEALKWISSNIRSFGGDPDQVTIFGQSAGGGSVSLLTLSPLTQGLFQRAIMQSGSSIPHWATQHPSDTVSHRTFARLVASEAGCEDLDDASTLVTCLRNVSAETLLNITTGIHIAIDDTGYMNPRVETTFNFLPDLPIHLLSQGKVHHVDTLRGYTSDEFAIFATFHDWESVDTILNAFLKTFTDLDTSIVFNLLKERYVKNGTALQQRQWAMDASEDLAFVVPIVMELNTVSTKVPEKSHYLYEFNYRKSWSSYPLWVNATHSDEIGFIFDLHSGLLQYNISQADLAVSKQMVEMWTSFAKTGSPTSSGAPQWSTYTRGAPNYMDIKVSSELKQWRRQAALDMYQDVLLMVDGWAAPQGGIVGK